MSLISKIKKAAAKKQTASNAKANVTAQAVIETPRNITTTAERQFTVGGKLTAGDFNKIRGVVGKLFTDAGLRDEWLQAVKANEIGNSKVVSEKLGTYDPEFKRLHVAIQDTFSNAGRPELASEFAQTVPTYTSNAHPVDYIATLLKGASHPLATAATDNQYKALEPLKPMMADALTSQGIAAPGSISDLSQLFYNKFIAKEQGVEALNFDTMQAGDQYHADEAVTNAIVTYVKTLADRKAAGDTTLSKLQDKIATAGLNVQSKLTEGVKAEVNRDIGATITGNTRTIMIVAAVGVAVLLFLAARK